MTADRDAGADDDALRWDGDEQDVSLPRGWRAVGKGAAAVHTEAEVSDVPTEAGTDDTPAGEREPEPLGNAALLGLGIFGGIYLLIIIGWLIAGFRLRILGGVLAGGFAPYDVGMWAAVAAVPIWFGTVFVLTRRSRTWVRFVWLAAGAVLMVPWPFVMLGAAG